MIQSLKPNELFVFGSNLAGSHGAGAAAQARKDFGAEWGVGEGITGQSYAFPTLDENLGKRTDEELKKSVLELYETCEENSNKTFLLTPVGTGIAGYSVDYMKSLFTNPPENLIMPEEFKK